MNLHKYIEKLYNIFPVFYDLQLQFFNGNHFKILENKLSKIKKDSILEIGCGTAPILKVFEPKKYVGVDIEEKFVKLAKATYQNKNFHFYKGDGRKIKITQKFDIILFSHTTHHLTDTEITKLLNNIKQREFKHIVIYDGRPTGILTPILVKLDFGAAKFRDVEDFIPLIGKNYKIIHKETFRSNRPFYKYQLLILKKI